MADSATDAVSQWDTDQILDSDNVEVIEEVL
jgi:hypothetical protein